MNKDPTARLAYKGIYQFFKQNFAKSEEYLNLALSRSDYRQNQIFCVEWLIHLYEAADNVPKLLWCYRKAAEYAPDNPEFQSRLGHVYYVDGKLDKAMYCFEQALRYDPNHGYSYYSIAKIHLVRGEDKKAEETLNTLIKINENHPLVYSELATLAAMHKEWERCEEYYKKSLLCGYKDPDELQKRIAAIRKFGDGEGVSGEDLPNEYYRRIEPKETKPDGQALSGEKDQ
ncbi:MAG: tetratricopeptide repeat protein [Oscillospiraceae bacterium]|nr:tetratricopeptide repeat protein [Oscillospiraceae bacterium]